MLNWIEYMQSSFVIEYELLSDQMLQMYQVKPF